MSSLLVTNKEEFVSGEVVEPGVYEDLESGAILEIREPDALPEGARVVHYLRRFRRIGQLQEDARDLNSGSEATRNR
ncbi:hypothetical protein CWRG_01683 [Chthonomonas calidirosea]|uniref:Uncharacterized protein n=1 Tax=Chthonomonas calidirosea (strain DSM 23976 / ICMP 18418 / T49) TaxID=1303518 RepID=S0EZE4_CHTCT|nr:hypothetical protein [Chthonomonas calidirosea]CCW36200.1 hypothetical protein CCALI_02396 [Chthonomonas calidirosea T49]CEK16983.1 hypothetical protein CP488_01697 [Chthonomonas calidirosea]CEK16984.1 hypothetical protein CWRG_01683 [Chthonomonas calidirosea]CEK18045.1 hypothetical protein CTKA_01700 [Chthonomonas calidirosea]